MSTIAKATIPVDIPDMWEGRCGSGFDRMDLPAEGICSALRRPKRFQRKPRTDPSFDTNP